MILLCKNPRFAIGFSGVCGDVLLFTEGRCLLINFSWKVRSNIHLYSLHSCGIIAVGDIFRFFEKLFLMSFDL